MQPPINAGARLAAGLVYLQPLNDNLCGGIRCSESKKVQALFLRHINILPSLIGIIVLGGIGGARSAVL